MSTKTLKNIVFLIPSLDPDEKMPEYVKELIKAGAKHILLINDGSKEINNKYFEEVENKKEVIVLRHAVNQGKGRALKTGFNYVLNEMKDIAGVVTADADGQHSVKDTIATANKLLETNQVIFGTRNFNEEIVPFKSRNGNKITTTVFKLLYGKLVNDTQTGLRGIPFDYLKQCLAMRGERFEYEIEMLIQMVSDKKEIVELPIETIYYNSNRETHFDTFKDSYRIYKVMLGQFFRFTGSGLLSSLIDLSLFTIFQIIFTNLDLFVSVLTSTALARVISSFINYLLNKNTVFKNNEKSSLYKYYILVCLQMLASWLLVSCLSLLLPINKTIIKALVDIVLFVISYQVQRKWVFKKEN